VYGRDAVCLCVDARMLIPAFFVACSVKRAAAAAGDEFDIVIVVPPGDLMPEHRSFAASRGIIVDDTLDTSAVGRIVVQQRRLSPATLVKLLLARHFLGRYRRIIYLDADLTIHGNVGTLFRLDMGDYPLAAVPAGRIWQDQPDAERDRTFAHFAALGMTFPYRYFNAGVLVIDPGNWCREKLDQRTVAFLRQHPDLCQLPDEDALNAVLDGELLELSPIWNISPKRFVRGQLNPIILHYTGHNKPWLRFRKYKRVFEHHEAYCLYAEFLKDTPWPDWLSSQWSTEDLAGSLRHEVSTAIEWLLRKHPLADRSRRAAFDEEQRRYFEKTLFVDVEQGLVDLPILAVS